MEKKGGTTSVRSWRTAEATGATQHPVAQRAGRGVPGVATGAATSRGLGPEEGGRKGITKAGTEAGIEAGNTAGTGKFPVGTPCQGHLYTSKCKLPRVPQPVKMAAVEQLQAQIAQMQMQQIQMLEGLQRANQSVESQAKRLNETETRLQEQTEKLNRTETELAQRTQALAQQATQLAQAQQAQASSTQQAGVEMTKLIHPSNVPKPQVWDGKREGWEKFKHVFVAWSSTVHPKYPEMLEKVWGK